MLNRNTIEYLGVWEIIYNPTFKPLEFEGFKANNIYQLIWIYKYLNALKFLFILTHPPAFLPEREEAEGWKCDNFVVLPPFLYPKVTICKWVNWR